MAIIVREDKILDGKKYDSIKVYKSEKFPITKDDEIKAEKLDEYLSIFFKELNIEVKTNNLIKLKGNKGVIDLWYYVGKKLSFIDNPKILNPNDRKYVWSALWFHAGDLAPGDAKFRAGTKRDHFSYCYRISKFEKEFVLNAGSWRDWMDFFDSPILSNKKILDWFEKKTSSIKELSIKYWLREFLKYVRNEFLNVDLSFLKKEEIESKLDIIFKKFLDQRRN